MTPKLTSNFNPDRVSNNFRSPKPVQERTEPVRIISRKKLNAEQAERIKVCICNANKLKGNPRFYSFGGNSQKVAEECKSLFSLGRKNEQEIWEERKQVYDLCGDLVWEAVIPTTDKTFYNKAIWRRGVDGIQDRDLKCFLAALRDCGDVRSQGRVALNDCGVIPAHNLIHEALKCLVRDWEAALVVFLWAASQQGFNHNGATHHSIIFILCKAKQFRTAWGIVEEMHRRRVLHHKTMYLLMKCYAAANDVAKAVNIFHSLERFGMKADLDAFHSLITALCRFEKVHEAESLLYDHRNDFEYVTNTYNIILDGWCNKIKYMEEVRRFWKHMNKKKVEPDAFTYSILIHFFADKGCLIDVLRLYDGMKQKWFEPDIKVYNAVILALANEACVNEVRNVITIMSQKGVMPNVQTYNSIMEPLCRANRIAEAYQFFDEMVKRGLKPDIRSFGGFAHAASSTEDVLVLLRKMKQKRCVVPLWMYAELIGKLAMCGDLKNIFNLWNDMKEHWNYIPENVWTAMIHALSQNGQFEEAYKYYKEMKSKGFSPRPKTESILKLWIENNNLTQSVLSKFKEGQEGWDGDLPDSPMPEFKEQLKSWSIEKKKNAQFRFPYRKTEV